MAVTILTRRSDTPSKRPDPDVIFNGELALNFDAATGGLYYKDTDDNIVKVGPCQVSATAPNSTPGAGGSAGNSLGEFWFDSTSNSLFVWNGTIWVDTTLGIAVQSVSGTSPIEIDNTDPLNPIVGIDTATTSSLGVVQVGTNINVTAGTISVPAATTAAQGAVQVGTNIDVAAGTISVANSSTTAKGVVQLNDTTNNSSTNLALTAAQGKNLQDQIDALAITSNLTFAGIFDTTVGPNGVMTTVSAEAAGLTVPFVIGNPLPAPAAENAEFFVIVAGAVGVYGPTTVPASAPPYHVGDWFLSDGTNWEFLNVGFQAPAATTAVEGVVYLATDLEVQTGTDTSNKAVNPASLQAKVSDSTSTTSSTTIASSTAVKAAYEAGVAAQGTADQAVLDAAAAQSDADQALLDAAAAQGDATQALSDATTAQGTADQAVLDAAAAQGTADAALPLAGGTMTGDIVFNSGQTFSGTVSNQDFQAKGDLVAGYGANSFGIQSVGTNGQVLSANSACASGLEWVAAGGGGGTPATPTVAGIVLGCTINVNTALGCNAFLSNTSGALNTAIGVSALSCNTGGGGNTAIGFCALYSNTVGCCNTANGIQALLSNTTGCCNTAIGNSALYFNISGCANTAVGMFALVSNTTGCCNTATGYQALCKNTTGGCNTATGFNALLNNTTGGCNVAVGLSALRANTTGFWTTATGFCALASNTTGNFNVADGACALFSNTTGNCNIAVGFLALRATTGSANVAVGAQSGCGITTGSGNIAFGGVTSGGSYSPVFSPTTENDRIVMGSNAVTNAYVQVAWTVTSDARDKTNVTALPVGLDFVNQLNPVSFQFKESRECDTAIGPVRYGFLAQEVLEAEGENPVIVDTEVPESLKITNDHFNAVLVKAIKELSAKINTLEAEIKGLKSNS